MANSLGWGQLNKWVKCNGIRGRARKKAKYPASRLS